MQMKEKIELLKKVGLFSKLKGKEIEVIAQYSQFYDYKQGQIIFEAESQGEELYIIEKGQILVTKRTGDDTDKDLARFIPGECFGELDLLDSTLKSATAVAEKDTTLLIFPMKGILFKDILEKHPGISAHILYKLLGMIAGRIRRTNKLISEKTPWIYNLRRQLLYDQLTGLFNRTFLEEDLAVLLPEYGPRTGLIMIKPDNFKEVNDTFGHEAGDNVLRMMADTVQEILREGDVSIRYRGDEFAAVLPNTEESSAIEVAEELKTGLSRINISETTGGRGFYLTFSMGIAIYPLHAEDNISLIEKAFEKMFEARNSGGDCVLCVSFNERCK